MPLLSCSQELALYFRHVSPMDQTHQVWSQTPLAAEPTTGTKHRNFLLHHVKTLLLETSAAEGSMVKLERSPFEPIRGLSGEELPGHQ